MILTGRRGLKSIAIHPPRGPEELDSEKVTAAALGAMGLTQPVAIDNEQTIVSRFANQLVPAYYVFNPNRELRHFQAGDKGYDRVEVPLPASRVTRKPQLKLRIQPRPKAPSDIAGARSGRGRKEAPTRIGRGPSCAVWAHRIHYVSCLMMREWRNW